MLVRFLALFAFFASYGISFLACAQEPGDPAKGLKYAQRSCASCHAIRKGAASSPNSRAREFEAIANTSGVTGISLAASLHSVHEHMPNFVLSANERDDIIAYILSLKHER